MAWCNAAPAVLRMPRRRWRLPDDMVQRGASRVAHAATAVAAARWPGAGWHKQARSQSKCCQLYSKHKGRCLAAAPVERAE